MQALPRGLRFWVRCGLASLLAGRLAVRAFLVLLFVEHFFLFEAPDCPLVTADCGGSQLAKLLPPEVAGSQLCKVLAPPRQSKSDPAVC